MNLALIILGFKRTHALLFFKKALHLANRIVYYLLTASRNTDSSDSRESAYCKDCARTVLFSLGFSEKHQNSLRFLFFISLPAEKKIFISVDKKVIML